MTKVSNFNLFFVEFMISTERIHLKNEKKDNGENSTNRNRMVNMIGTQFVLARA